MITARRYPHKIYIDISQRRQAERLCEEHIGPRIYYLQRNVGGKKWYITSENQLVGRLELGVEDPKWLSFLALQLT
ncbi:MAG: hypothetical protein N2235_05345 [Fischerella sp.]|nr:hypothetical protein [Fischerella sp.]